MVTIDTVNLKFSTDYVMTMKWYDSRLSFDDLNDDASFNQITQQEKVKRTKAAGGVLNLQLKSHLSLRRSSSGTRC